MRFRSTLFLFLFPLAGLWAQSASRINEQSTDTSFQLLNVLFATNEDGELYINNNSKGLLTKAEHRVLKMTPGNYFLRLKSKATGDEYRQSFLVTAGGLNEVFADMLFAIDEAKAVRDSITRKAAATVPTETINSTTTSTPQVTQPSNNTATSLPKEPATTSHHTAATKEPPVQSPGSTPVRTEVTPTIQLASGSAAEPPVRSSEVKVTTVEDKARTAATLQVANELSGNMAAIAGGNFIMGNNKAGNADETEHRVSISPLRFGKYEVTQRQWEQVMGFNPSYNKGCAQCPVENVTWEEAVRFIQRLNSVGNKKFRLPTEAEWEYVARLGGPRELARWGGEEGMIKSTAWYYGNSDKRTHPVGTKSATAAGVYDLLGNVAEWCADWYDASYFKDETLQNNPQGPPLGKEKVVRGGSYADFTGDRFRPSLRHRQRPTQKSVAIGFRLVMDN